MTCPPGPPGLCLPHCPVFLPSSQFLSYQDKRINHGNLPHLQQRVRFAASDPSQYDASINLMNLQVADTATYECRVKKTTMATRKVIVTVQGMYDPSPLGSPSPDFRAEASMAALRPAVPLRRAWLTTARFPAARPAVPMCWSEGHMAYGNDVVLKCFASGGTPPLSYKWAKISGQTHPYRAGSYHSQHTFQSELSYQESFHSSINQGEGGGTSGWSGLGGPLGPP